jgi:aspartyl-tRNA(Asn)/glutamyl-tRNA(Gln) amidotransferase subunit A
MKNVNSEINAIVTWNERIEDEVENFLKRDLDPYPIAVKDIIDVKGLRVSMGSRVFINRISERDAEVIKRIRASAGVIIGMTNTHEFASGVTTTSSVYGPTRNPRDPSRIAGGSSGGSAAAVAADIVPVALGTDTAGSVRIPASLTGVYGFKPTYGVINTDGVFPLAPSLDTIGILAKSIDWVKRVFTSIGDRDAMYYMEKILRRRESVVRDIKRIKVGIPKWFRASEEVYNKFMNKISSLDHVIIDMENFEKRLIKYFPVIRLAEASNIHMRYRDKWDLYFPDVRELVKRGLEIPAYEYIEALRVREELYKEFRRIMKAHNLILLAVPTTPIPAPSLEDTIGRELEMREILSTVNVTIASFLGLPAISVPSLEVNNLPVGIQLIADRFYDLLLIDITQKLRDDKLI